MVGQQKQQQQQQQQQQVEGVDHTQERHEAFLAKHLARIQKTANMRRDEEDGGEKGEAPAAVSLFWKTFTGEKDSISAALKDIESAATGVSSRSGGVGGGTTASETTAKSLSTSLDGLVARVRSLQESVARATLFLPHYDHRRAQEEVGKLDSEIKGMRGALAPRKKFSFGRKAKGKAQAGAGAAPPTWTPGSQGSQGSESTNSKGYSGNVEGAGAAEQEPSLPPPLVTGVGSPPAAPSAATKKHGPFPLEISHRTDEVLVYGERELKPTAAAESRPDSGVRDLNVTALVGCVVVVLDVLDALRLRDLTDCKVYCGPVRGSVYVHECHNCTIMAGGRQLRIHDSTKVDFYVHTFSGPILEDCSGLRFAPYSFSYPALQTHFELAGFQGVPSAWADVKDFKWHRAQQSPNWQLLPEAERVSWSEEEARVLQQQRRGGERGGGLGVASGGGEGEEDEEEL